MIPDSFGQPSKSTRTKRRALVRVTSQKILTVFYFQGNFMTLS